MPKVVVITGASAGVGRACVRAFARAGYDVGLVARGRAGLEAAAAEVEATGRRAFVAPVDVADYDRLGAVAASVEDALGPIAVWVNDAFGSVFAKFIDVHPEEFRRTTEVAYLGYVHGTRVALDRMLPRDRGVIVQVGSALGYRGIPLQAAYCGAKHAIKGFTESLRAELQHDGSAVSVTMVQLPAVNTPQFSWVLSRLPKQPQPVPPIFQPELTARAVLWAAEHPNRRQYFVGGSTVATIGANALIPGLLDRYLARTGFKSQQTEEPSDSERPANLWRPVDERSDYGAHGSFDDRAHHRSLQWWYTTHRRSVVSGLGATAVLGLALQHLRGGGHD
jgi:NAD(P)-dependent dehydrogenase (short-subunit alcohol dehydrogenase family)